MDENENGKKRVVSSRFSTIPVIINQMHQPLCQATPVNSLDGGVTFCDIKIQKKIKDFVISWGRWVVPVLFF